MGYEQGDRLESFADWLARYQQRTQRVITVGAEIDRL